MASTLRAVKSHPSLRLQIIATGMHLDSRHGDGIASIRREGWHIDAVVPWPGESEKKLSDYAAHTGLAMAGLALSFEKLKSDIILVVGDRVEAFAAASAAHLSGRVVAHVHGGDRAAGQTDDCLRHAISKLAHIHFPATRMSADRLLNMGEDRWRIHRFGSPGVDGIATAAASWGDVSAEFPDLTRRRFALVVHHPVDPSADIEAERMRELLAAVVGSVDRVVVVYPNNDPGSEGIRRVLDEFGPDDRLMIRRDISRPVFLGLMRDAAVMVGNSSSGIIEAGSFGTPAIDVGPRQMGRERGPNVFHVDHGQRRISSALRELWDGHKLVRLPAINVYGGSGAGKRIAAKLSRLKLDARLRRKLISY